MPAQPRDLLKPRSQRAWEVMQAVQYQQGMADGQYVTFGCKLAPGGTTSQLAISDGEYALAGSLIQFPTNTGVVLSTAANWAGSVAPTNTGAGQTCLVLVEADGTQPTPVITLTQGAIVTANPVLPTLTPTRIALGYLVIPASFTFGTTALTAGGTSLAPTGGICVTMSYDAGNVNPAGTQGPTGSTGGF